MGLTFNQIKKLDPTRTLTLRTAYASDMSGRFSKLMAEVNNAIVADDVFGLMEKGPLKIMQSPGKKAFEFTSNKQKVAGFMKWLERQENLIIFNGTVKDTAESSFWTNKYIESSYKKGMMNAYIQGKKEGLPGLSEMEQNNIPGLNITKETFMQGAFNTPIHADAVGMLYSRNFDGLKNITTAMDTQIAGALANGLAKGDHPRVIARGISGSDSIMSKIGKTRARVLARTETIRAYNEAQLNSYEQLGAMGVKVEAEWSAAEDDRVCSLCEPLDGVVMSIDEARGSIPRHPNCRCSWLPVNVEDKGKKEKHKLDEKKDDAIQESFANQLTPRQQEGIIEGEGTPEEIAARMVAEGKSKSTWASKNTFDTGKLSKTSDILESLPPQVLQKGLRRK